MPLWMWLPNRLWLLLLRLLLKPRISKPIARKGEALIAAPLIRHYPFSLYRI